jgi:hypothetical protein
VLRCPPTWQGFIAGSLAAFQSRRLPGCLAESSGESGLRTPERRSGPVAASRCPWWRLPIASGGGEWSLLTSGGMTVCLRRRREENKRERATLLTTVYVAQIAKWLAHSLSML